MLYINNESGGYTGLIVLFNGDCSYALFGRHVRLLWNVDAQYTVFHLCLNLCGVGIFGQYECLLKLCVRELAAQVASLAFAFLIGFLLFLLRLLFASSVAIVTTAVLLHCYREVVVAVDADLEIVLAHTGRGYLYLVLLVGLKDVDGWCGGAVAHEQFVVEEIVENAWNPVLGSLSHWHAHNIRFFRCLKI